jgi:hypothetical protein
MARTRLPSRLIASAVTHDSASGAGSVRRAFACFVPSWYKSTDGSPPLGATANNLLSDWHSKLFMLCSRCNRDSTHLACAFTAKAAIPVPPVVFQTNVCFPSARDWICIALPLGKATTSCKRARQGS